MRNKVKLYIEGVQADLDDGAFLLLNYTREDLENPTIVRNSFSKQITLKGTPTNDAIFGHIYRNDRNTLYGSPYNGPYFDPCRKTSFVLYNDTNEILESGYLKLDSIEQTKRKRSYKVTLYGGLGSFLYGLSYKGNGDKMTLADLDYGETLDFTINATTVKNAWARIGGDTSKAAKWEVLNFMPAYGGFPSGEFNADKAVVNPSLVGLPSRAEGGRFTPSDGWVLCQLAEKVTGNEAKDFRSYLQKPVLRVKSLIDAICDPSNNGGWTVNQDAGWFDSSNHYWDDVWITLPSLDKLNIDVTGSSGSAPVSSISNITIPGGGVIATKYDIEIHVDPYCSQTGGLYTLYCEDDWAAGMGGDESPGYFFNWVEVIVIVSRNGGSSKMYTFRFSTTEAPDGSRAPTMDGVAEYINSSGYFSNGGFDIVVSDYGVTSISLQVNQGGVAWGHLRASADPDLVFPNYTYDYTDGVSATFSLSSADVSVYVDGASSSTVRTGANITKSLLLASDHTPADYLLSYCKMFGLQLVCHKDTKTIDIVQRKNLYSSTVVDINGRIDRGKEIIKKPFSFDARWYAWETEHTGAWADYYKEKYGTFGQFRVNTGYEFDASDKSVTDGIIFKGLCDVLETSKYFCTLYSKGYVIPSLFLGGGKYSLYRAGGETIDVDIPLYSSATKVWDNTSDPMHDSFTKVQIHGKDNAPFDERDTLVFFDGMEDTSGGYYSLTDDTIPMVSLNGNAPCWLPFYCRYDKSAKISSFPHFSRYWWSGSTIYDSLDWGDPEELQIPSVTVGTKSNVFEQFWEKYISDRYDDDSAVVTAYVNLDGMQVNENLLRQFYAFDGAIWALNRIIDYSFTTDGPTKCEFVKVQDTTNYTTL